MRTIIAGSRTITDFNLLLNAVREANYRQIYLSCVLSGGASGIDQLGIQLAKEWGLPYEIYPAEWGKYGKAAGMIRNKEMASKADALVAVWDGESRGTAGMIEIAHKYGLEVYVYTIGKETGQ